MDPVFPRLKPALSNPWGQLHFSYPHSSALSPKALCTVFVPVNYSKANHWRRKRVRKRKEWPALSIYPLSCPLIPSRNPLVFFLPFSVSYLFFLNVGLMCSIQFPFQASLVINIPSGNPIGLRRLLSALKLLPSELYRLWIMLMSFWILWCNWFVLWAQIRLRNFWFKT